MTPGVIDLLEVIDVEYADSQYLTTALGPFDFLVQPGKDAPAVGKAGEGIGPCLKDKVGLEAEDSGYGSHTGFEFFPIKGFGEEVIGSCFECLEVVGPV